jgi:galactose oxidase-like protein
MKKSSKLFSLLLLGLIAFGCSSGVDVTFKLLNPCSEEVLFNEGQCQYIQLSIFSQDPNDPLYWWNLPEELHSTGRTCDITEGSCNISDDELLGPARVVEVLCFTTLEAPPVARATSQVMQFDSSPDGIGTKTLYLMIGNINEFAYTTVLDSNSPDWASCSLMGQGEIGRYGHSATLLDDGTVLIAGGIRRYGQGVEEILATAEIYDPVSGKHRLITDAAGNPIKMAAPSGRAFHTATLLRDGRVLIAGGVGLIDGKRSTLKSAELYDPITGSFPQDAISIMGSGRAHHAATSLATGEVLISGGALYEQGVIVSYLNNANIYKPPTNTFEQIESNMSTARAFHVAVLLDPNKYNGNVVIIGGENIDGPLNSIDIYNAQANQFYEDVDVVMAENRSHLAAVRLTNGEVVVIGGKTGVEDTSVDDGVEIFDPAAGTFGGFASGSPLSVARMDHTATLLDNGNVLVSGGKNSAGQGIGIADLVTMGAGTYPVQQLTDFLDPQRFGHAATKLRNGWVLLSGGLPSIDTDAMPITQSMLFVPQQAWEQGTSHTGL